MKKFFKEHWKDIIIVLILIFGISKCTSSCTTSLKVNQLSTQLSQKDSVIDSLNMIITKKANDINVLNEKIDVQSSQLENHYKIDSINASKQVHVVEKSK